MLEIATHLNRLYEDHQGEAPIFFILVPVPLQIIEMQMLVKTDVAHTTTFQAMSMLQTRIVPEINAAVMICPLANCVAVLVTPFTSVARHHTISHMYSGT